MNRDFGQVSAMMLSVALNNFQYQDKLDLIRELENEPAYVPFQIAVHQFVDEFGEFHSPGTPYPRRIGRWIGLYAPAPVIESLLAWADEDGLLPNTAHHRREFAEALRFAKAIDRTTRPPRAA